MKIAVTGGAGFIGSHITDAYIAAGHEVVIIDNFSSGREENVNPAAKVVKMDITDPKITKLFAEEKFDILNHHAAQMDVRKSVADPQFDATVNILGGLNLYEAARQSGSVKKIIFASTGGAIYGEQRYFPADEKHPKRPMSPYGVSKLSNEKYLTFYKNVYGIEHVIFRYTNVYGPRQNPHGEAGVIAIFTEKMLDGEQPVINGDGTQTRDYVYVSDVVQASMLALRDEAFGIFNVATGVETSVNTLFQILRMRTGSKCKQTHIPAKAGEQKRSVCTAKKLEDVLGWHRHYDIERGLAETVDWFKLPPPEKKSWLSKALSLVGR